MGYRMSKQKVVGYNPYFLMFGKDPKFQSRLQLLQNEELYPDATVERLQIFLDEQGKAFTWMMPLAMKNLAIAQHRDKERNTLVRGGGLDRHKAASQAGGYVLLKHQTDSTLDASAIPHVLWVVEIRPSRVAVSEETFAAKIKE